ncbi:hypothetical protein [Arcobacter sp. LA11]|uniref:hypothetical protein n=1 Tax=Arcobacter sp. LA11 TaxID=1898176 RepID=UPI00093499BB|nr:hypothetical protein [Arcobacter sp. LA11]
MKKIIFLVLLLVLNLVADDSQLAKDAISYSKWMAKALNDSGYKADFSIESLNEIDRFFDENTKKGIPTKDGFLSKDLGSRLFGLGSYVGEVIRRKIEGEWIGNDDDPKGEINIKIRTKNNIVFWPIQRIMKRLKNGKEDNIYSYANRLIEYDYKK